MQSPPMPPPAIDFFAKFARFEYALKSFSKYRRVKKGVEVAEADWDKFAKKEHIDSLYERLKMDEATKYIVEHPPKERIVKGSSLGWSSEPPRCETVAEVCRMMRRARNNLFHGDKGSVGSEHDKNLLAAGIAVMDALLEADNEVAQQYYYEW